MSSPFRFKVSLAAAAVVILLIVGMYVATVFPLADHTTEEVESSVQRASRLVSRSQKLYGYELLTMAQTVAEKQELVSGVVEEDERQRRLSVYGAVEQADEELKARGRKADFLGVVDREGAIIARDLDPNNMYGEKLTQYKNVQLALEGRASKDVWNMKNKMMRSAAAPIVQGGMVAGAVIIAYEMTAAEAREERDQFGTQVAYFMGDNIRASSFSLGSNNTTENAELADQLNSKLLGAADAPGRAALAAGKETELFTVKLLGERYLAKAAPLPVRLTEQQVGYVVLANLDRALEPVVRVRWVFLIMGLAMLILVLGGMWLVARHFVDAEDKLELGVAEIISGNTDYTFDDHQEFEGLANALNVMLARLLGRPEPGEDEEGDSAWRADVLFVDEVTHDTESEAQVAQRLAAEPEEQYYARLYHEYVAARQKFNLPVDGITAENLTQKLRANEALLRAKHKCSMVRFIVQAEGGKVSLKPVRIA